VLYGSLELQANEFEAHVRDLYKCREGTSQGVEESWAILQVLFWECHGYCAPGALATRQQDAHQHADSGGRGDGRPRAFVHVVIDFTSRGAGAGLQVRFE